MLTNPIDQLREVYRGASRLTGRCPASRYLASIGLRPDPQMRFIPNVGEDFVVAWHALLLPMWSEDGKRIVGLHCAWIDDRGREYPKNTQWPRTWDRIGEVGTIRFGEPDGALGVAERWQSALAMRQQYSMPCWAYVFPWRAEHMKLPMTVQQVVQCEGIVYGNSGDRAVAV